MAHDDRREPQVERYPLASALLGRRSRRFAPGMEIPSGPFAYASARSPRPLTEEEQATLVFAAAGLSGHALADLSYGPGMGGTMLSGMTGRVVGSADSLDTVALFVIDDEATWFVHRPQNLTAHERDEIITLYRAREFVAAWRRLRVRVADGRTELPTVPGLNFNINRWAAYAPGTTYFLPVSDLTGIYINALLESFEPEMGLAIVDERNAFQPAGIGSFLRSRGGHLWDDPNDGRVVTVEGLETSLVEATGVEMGGMLQGLGLMSQALGLGGYSNYARNEFGWFEALGFRMRTVSSARYAGARGLVALGAKVLGRTFPFPFPVGLERNGEALLEAWCPPNQPDMEAAVDAFLDYKYGPEGMWRSRTRGTAWLRPEEASTAIRPPSDAAVEATKAYCSYLHERYGRFPVYPAPFRTAIAYQASHVDPDFYDRFFETSALTETQRGRWNDDGDATGGG